MALQRQQHWLGETNRPPSFDERVDAHAHYRFEHVVTFFWTKGMKASGVVSRVVCMIGERRVSLTWLSLHASYRDKS